MTYVIAEPCVNVVDQACVAVCPVDCIHWEGVSRHEGGMGQRGCVRVVSRWRRAAVAGSRHLDRSVHVRVRIALEVVVSGR